MKKILIFSLAYYPLHIGGAEVSIKEITDRIDPNEITFHLICNRYDASLPKEERVGNVLVHRIGFAKKGADTAATHHPLFYLVKMLFIPLAVFHAVRLHRRYHFDGAWAMMVYMTIPLMCLRLFGVRIPYVLTLEEGDSFEHVFRRWYILPFLPLIKGGIRGATIVHAISSFLGGWARRVGFKGSLEIIPNGVDVSHFSRRCDLETKAQIRTEWGVGAEDTVLVHVGRMVPKNGIGDVIRALAFLPSDIVFVQIGSGPEEASLRAVAHASGVSKRVHFLGFVAQRELPAYLQASDIFIRPSLSEGMGNSFVEAMAARTPIIGTQEGGIADFLFDPERNPEKKPTGRAVHVQDPKDIARVVLRVLADTTLTVEMVENAQRLVRAQYEWDQSGRAMRDRVFSRMLGI